MRTAAVGVCLVGCSTGQTTAAEEPCEAEPVVEGLIVEDVRCRERLIGAGEGRTADGFLANNLFRAVFRHGQESLTAVGLGGGTLIDAAPWGQSDRLHELIPLVGGGWLEVDALDEAADGFTVHGRVRSLPDARAEREGELASVTWRVRPDSLWLELSGADGLWIHANGGHSVLDGQVVAGDLVIGHNGAEVEDLGGALRVAEADAVLIASRDEAWAALAVDPIRLEGVAPGATDIELWRDDRLVGRLPVRDGRFDSLISGEINAVRAVAGGHLPGDVVAPGTALELAPGPSGAVVLDIASEREPRLVRVDWRAVDGRWGWTQVPAAGGRLALGPGSFTLTLSAGPASIPRTLAVDIPSGGTRVVRATLEQRFDPEGRVLALIGQPSDRSRTWRGTDAFAVDIAAGLGADYVVLTPEDDVSDFGDYAGMPVVSIQNGSLTAARSGSWRIWSWPWSANLKSGHGAADLTGLDPQEALLTVWGATRDRYTMVDTSFLAVTDPAFVDPAPDFVRLEDPGPSGPEASDWQSWFAWLDASVPVAPVGPLTWVEVDDPARVARVDIERGLVAGRVAATTGPLITISVHGNAGPGDVAEARAHGPIGTRVGLKGGEELDHLALIGSGGVVLASWPVTSEAEDQLYPGWLDQTWVMAMAWSAQGSGWAVSGPVWVDPPGEGSNPASKL